MNFGYNSGMRKFSLTKLIPKSRNFLYWLMPRLLDFSDFRRYQSRIQSVESQIIELQNRIRHAGEIDSYYLELLSIISPIKSNIQLTRVGSKFDGGYLVPRNYLYEQQWITIGLGFNVDFENDLKSNNSFVNSFDHTISNRPAKLLKGVTWHKLGWGVSDKDNELISLKKIMNLSCINYNDSWCLKFDIEGNEWNVLDEINELEYLPDIICCEIHDLKWNEDQYVNQKKTRMLKELFFNYFCVNINGNNFSANMMSKFIEVHDTIELTLIKKTAKFSYQIISTEGNKLLLVKNHPNDVHGRQTHTSRIESE